MLGFSQSQKAQMKEIGCTEPFKGKKSKCIIKIVPQKYKCESIEIHNKCTKII